MRRSKNKKILSLLSFLSIGSIISSIVIPYSINANNNHNSEISIQNNKYSNFSYNGITNIAQNVYADSELSSKYPIELFFNEQNENLLKDLIISHVVNPASQLTHNDISINKNESVVNNFSGSINLVFDIANYKAVINNGSQLVTTQSRTFRTTIENLQVATASTIPTENQEIAVPSEFSTYTNVQAIDFLQKNILPSVIGGTQLSVFSLDIRKAQPIFPDKLSISVIVGNYFDSRGEFVNYSGLVNFTLNGFKSLVNSSINNNVDASVLAVDSDSLNIDNTFDLIKANINNLAKELTKDDIANFSVDHFYSESKAILNFDIINGLWINDGIVESQRVEMSLINVKNSLATTVNSVIRNSSLSAYTSSEVKATSNDDWKANTTIKTIIAAAINNPAPDTIVNAVDIEIVNVKEIGSLGNNNYAQLDVDFNLINFSGYNNEGKVVNSLPLKTTIQGFKTSSATSINSKILAKVQNSSNIGFEVLDNIYSTELSTEQAKSIISSNIFNANGLVSPNDIEITNLQADLNNAVVNVQFNLKNNKFVDSDGNIFLEKAFTTQIFGFKFFSGATSFTALSNGLTLSSSSSFVTPIVLPNLLLQNNVSFIQSVVRSLISGPTPKNMRIEVSNFNSSVQGQLSFDTTITNYFSSTGIETTPKTYTGIKIIDLPSNSYTGTYNLPVVPVKDQNNQDVITINDFRPQGNDFSKLKQLLIDKAIKLPYGMIRTSDIEIVSSTSNPNFSGTDNSITVIYKIINQKYKDPSSQVGTNSPELKVKFVGFDFTPYVNASNYAIQEIANPIIANEYPSEFLKNRLQTISNNSAYSISEKNILLQNELSQFAKINISNLNLDTTRFDFAISDRDGTLNINIYSSGFYTPSGQYVGNDTLITNFTLRGFATSNVQAETTVVWSGEQMLQMFASDLNLLNVQEVVTINNLPVGVRPNYSFTARDYIIEQGTLLDYGEVDVTITLNSYFDVNGNLVSGQKKFIHTFRTIPFLNTKLDTTTNVILNFNDKGVVASEAKESSIKKIIASNLQQTPPDFSAIKDIIDLVVIKTDDATGQMQVNFKLTKYYKDGKVVTAPLSYENILIRGFYKVLDNNSSNKKFYEEQWFILLVSVTGGSILLLLIILILIKIRLNKKRNNYY